MLHGTNCEKKITGLMTLKVLSDSRAELRHILGASLEFSLMITVGCGLIAVDQSVS
jgi:hypothetical protein